jgi:hypothetical protein
MGLAFGAVLVLSAIGVAGASAFPSTYCVTAGKETVSYKVGTKTKTKSVYTGSYTEKDCATAAPSGTYRAGGEPEGKYEKIKASALSEPEQEELKALLKYVKVQASGVGGKPTVQVAGANVQILSGAGAESTDNGEGNLVVGYDENRRLRLARTTWS